MEQLAGQLLLAILPGVGDQDAQPQLGQGGGGGRSGRTPTSDEDIHFGQLIPPGVCLIECGARRRTLDMGVS
jgi:hypothetical protein